MLSVPVDREPVRLALSLRASGQSSLHINPIFN